MAELNTPLLPSSPWDVLRPQTLRLLCVSHFWTVQHDCLNLCPCKSISGKPRKLKYGMLSEEDFQV